MILQDSSSQTRGARTKLLDMPNRPDLLIKAEEEWKHAVQTSNNKKLKQIFEQFNNRLNFANIYFENGDNSLHYAARTGNTKLAKLLIIVGLDVC